MQMRISRGFAGECSSQSFFCDLGIAAPRELPIMRLHRHGADEKHPTATVSREEKNPEIKG
ncbi:hypothetical protein EJD93_01520 [Cronobacter sakazakii]|nr:hypothetical protein [Cronobacter sakazakii]UEQ64565.1 hypothetical protein EJD93_01520 [Cronobacter sakazakii]